MGQFTIQMCYNATITVVVDANNEGEALDKARNVAEDADLDEFSITTEREATVLNVH